MSESPTATSARHERLAEIDKRHVWHPFTQMAGWTDEDPLIIEGADGAWLIDDRGRRFLDGISSLWVTVHGHRRKELDEAVRAQLDRVAHTTLLGLASVPSIELAERLVAVTPEGLNRVFYSDSGSTSVEVALKVCYQYWQQVGRPEKNEFATLKEAYHGDTIGSVSLGGIDLFHATYKALLFPSHKVDPLDESALEVLFESAGDRLAAFVVEPLVQGAAGMRMQPPGFLARLRALCDRHDVLLVADEVATGFGRTGRMFACEHENIRPDVLCLAKGITGGYLPLAATLFTDRIYEGFLGDFAELKTFFHGHTYTGNPLACAAALASLDLFERDRTLESLQPKIERLAGHLSRIAKCEHVMEVRQKGFMVGIETGPFPFEERRGHHICMKARERGVIVRPLGDVIVLMPPLSITDGELDHLMEVVEWAIEGIAGA
jgi:adenosylmethionine---8-amino-7-oxononanoate aminotransferase